MDVEKRNANVMFAKNGKGYATNRITLPVPWVKALGLSEDDREVELSLYENKIIIEKKK